jgi:hypothetical protein
MLTASVEIRKSSAILPMRIVDNNRDLSDEVFFAMAAIGSSPVCCSLKRDARE